jgi:superfamily I DNA/RNA helicase
VAALGAPGRAVGAFTFHALGLELLRAFPEAAGLRPGFTVLDEAARRALGERLGAEIPGVSSAAAALERVSRAKATGDAVELDRPRRLSRRLRAGAGGRRRRRLRRSGGPDRAPPGHQSEALAFAQDRCRYLFVDEYQDVNAAQVRLVQLLAPSAPPPNLCVVGDPDQAIYGFRGSDPSWFVRFASD